VTCRHISVNVTIPYRAEAYRVGATTPTTIDSSNKQCVAHFQTKPPHVRSPFYHHLHLLPPFLFALPAEYVRRHVRNLDRCTWSYGCIDDAAPYVSPLACVESTHGRARSDHHELWFSRPASLIEKKNTCMQAWPLRTTIYARHARTPACRRRSLLALREFVPIERGLTGRRPLERSVRVLVQALRFVPARHASLACTPASNEQPVGSSAPSDSWPGPMQGEAIVICIIDHHVFANESLSTPTLDF
jgi:hypothetical protein